jgi:hypothetical protein
MNETVVIALTAVAVVVLLCGTAQAESGSGKNGDGLARVEGTVSARTADSVTITTRAGNRITVMVNATTKIERNDARTTLAGILIGDRGQARYNATTLVAAKVESTGP